MKITNKLFRIFSDTNARTSFFDSVMTELQTQSSVTEQEQMQKIVNSYKIIVERLSKNAVQITLHPDDLSQITIDGKCYDLDSVFSHSNRTITECRMEIESLLADLSSQGKHLNDLIKEIEAALNHAVRQQER